MCLKGKHRWASVVAALVMAILTLLLLDQVILQAANEPAASPAGPAAPTNGPAFTAVVTDQLVGVTGVSAWGDYDNDGDLDILLTGYYYDWDVMESVRVARVYRNDGGDTFVTTITTDTLSSLSKDAPAWGDYDNDSDLDILLPRTGEFVTIYRNDGSDTFTLAVTDTLMAGLDLATHSAAWGDYDNDGDLDILLNGEYWVDGSMYPFTGVYRNDGDDTFTVAVTTNTLTGISSGTAVWGDYDNDGDLDILLSGCDVENNSCAGSVAKVYRNDGADTFTEAVTDTLTGGYSAAWGDYDNDGDLDILLAGCAAWGGGGACTDHTAGVYRNDGPVGPSGGWTFTEVITDPLTGGESAAWADYDNDGDLDVFLTGWDGNDSAPRIYRNDGDDTFVDTDAPWPDVSNSATAWGDYDGDGDLDILLTGQSSGDPIAHVYRNNTPVINAAPAAPGSPNAQVAGNTVTLSWTAPPPTATTPITGLTYNLYVGTAPGRVDVVPPMAFTVTHPLTNGLRLLPAMGNAQHGLTATYVLTYGTYYWGVQAVDHTFAGSPFAAEGQFTLANTAPIAAAGSDQSVDTNGPATLDGSASSDPDGHLPLSYLWTQTGGPPVTFNKALSITTFTAPSTPSVLTFSLTVTDSLGLPSTPDEVVVTVLPNQVDGVSPLPHSHTAAVTTTLTISTTRAVSQTTATTRTVSVHGGFHGHLNGAFSFGPHITFDPSQDLHPGELVQASVTTGVLDLQSGPLGAPYVWQFRTAASGGSGRFPTKNIIGLDANFSQAAVVGDLDGDGDLDLAVGNWNQPNRVYMNDGNGTFDTLSHTLGSSPDSTVALALGDLDGDGDLDVVTGNWSQAKVYLNDGDGSFDTTFHTLGGSSGGAYALALGDMDGDGDLDLVLGRYPNENMIYLNDGDGTFDTTSYALDASDATYALAAGDVDGDGDLDLAVGNWGEPGALYLNDGDGTFDTISRTIGIASDNTRSLVLADVDGDGDLDLAAANNGTQNVVYLNDGDGTFDTISRTFGTAGDTTPRSLAAGDMDGDGDLDLAVAKDGPENEVYLNTSSADLAIVKERVGPSVAYPGDTITYTLTISNTGPQAAFGVVVTDRIPVSVTHASLVVQSSLAITATGTISYTWEVEPLDVGEWGVITITGVLSDPLASGSFANTASIASDAVDTDTSDNTDSVLLTVSALPNQPPEADAGGDQSVDTGSLVTLDGSASSDPDGDSPLTYGWTQIGGSAVTFDAALSVTTFTAPGDPGVLTFTLVVTDSLGLRDPTPDEVVIAVTNQAPIANAGSDQSVDTGSLVTLDGSASSDPDGDSPLTYGWTQIGGEPVALSDPTAAQPTFIAPGDPGVLTFTLSVTDSLGLPDPTPDKVVVTVNEHQVYLPLVVRQAEAAAPETAPSRGHAKARRMKFE